MKEESLDKISRSTEILFGLIMVLTFTCSFSIATAGRGEIKDMLIAALGCNLAWGIIDAFFYLMTTVLDRARTRLVAGEDVRAPGLYSFSDFKAAFIIFSLVFLSTFPVAIPFMLMHDPWLALRTSNLVALILLFSMGYSLGVYAGLRPVFWGTGLAVIGALLVSLTIFFGG